MSNTYRQPPVDIVAPDAIIFIENEDGMKRTIKLSKISDTGEIVNEPIDLMNFVESISVSKGIDRVPGEATISLKMPEHATEDKIFGNIKNVLSTMLEIEIYFKGRFLYEDEPQYYPAFWGVISNISVSKTGGDLTSVTISCQDMMRWLAITKVNVNAAAAFPTIIPEETAGRGIVNGYSTIYAGLSTPGIVRDLLSLSISEDFFQPKDMNFNGRVLENSRDPIPLNADESANYNQRLAEIWGKKFESLGSALLIYGFSETTNAAVNSLQIKDVLLDDVAYKAIYGSNDDGIVRIDVSKAFPYELEISKAESPPTFQADFKSRLDIANEIKNQLHLEFFQDVDGAIVLKPPFYNLEVKENLVCVIEDIDIVNFNLIEDESAIITRVDVRGDIISGGDFIRRSDANHIYGYAIDFSLLQKYGLRDDLIQTNFITTAEDAMYYAERELSRRNSLIYNASVTIQGRPELKLGYPVYFPGRDEYYYVTGIEHSFTFGSSFDTSLVLSGRRSKRTDANNNPLKNMLAEVFPAANPEDVQQGKDTTHDDNPMNNLVQLCNTEEQQFVVERPNYRWSALEDILKYQGSFRFTENMTKPSGNAAKYQQITDDDGYELVGKYPYGKDLILTEDFRIITRDNRGNKNSEIVSGMTLSVSGNERPTLRYQQPISLNQLQNIDVVLQRSKSSIIESMRPNQ